MKISIVTAVWNREGSIADCLRSVNQQSYTDIEHILVDGGSTDHTLQIIAQSDRRPGPMVSERDNGIYDAINKGIRMATGDYVGLMHADDLFDNEQTVAHIAQLLKESGADALYGDLEYVTASDTSKVVRYWKSGSYYQGIMNFGWMPPHPTVFIKRELFEKFGYYRTDMRIAADYERMLHLFHFAKIKPVYLPQVITRMRVGGASNKSLKNIMRKSREDLRAWSLRGYALMGIWALFCKNASKLGQFWKRR